MLTPRPIPTAALRALLEPDGGVSAFKLLDDEASAAPRYVYCESDRGDGFGCYVSRAPNAHEDLETHHFRSLEPVEALFGPDGWAKRLPLQHAIAIELALMERRGDCAGFSPIFAEWGPAHLLDDLGLWLERLVAEGYTIGSVTLHVERRPAG
jgi:hypothetical protein